MKRVFIVGVARSGTTLLQSMLASHSSIHTFPETHFLDKTIPKQKWLRYFNFIGKKENQFIASFLNSIDSKQKYKSLYTASNFKWVNHLLGLLDDEALSYGKNIWVEKTPLHLHYIKLLSSVDKEAFFIHLVREGKDNISSLFEVSLKNPDNFKQNTLAKSIYRYKTEISISSKYKNYPNHHFVRYEKLVTDCENELKKIFVKIGLDYNKEVLDYKKTLNRIITEKEVWKSKNKEELSLSNKFNEIFSKEEKDYIINSIKEVDLTIFND